MERPGNTQFDPGRRHVGGLWQIAIVIASAAILLLPFSDKAFHMDDTLFIWVARQVVQSPLDFFGFTGNWGGVEEEARRFIKNPPLVSYYIALAGTVFGWSERALHIAMTVPAALAATGAWLLARRLCSNPLAATLAGVLTPVFAVSGTTVMCDMTMLALWVWAVFLWVKGIEDGRWRWLAISSILIAAASLAKYFAISLIPLLAVYTIFKGRRHIKGLVWLAVPVAILALYQFYTEGIYGRGLLLDASAYSVNVRSADGTDAGLDAIWKIILGLSFTGGGAITILFIQTLIRPAKALPFILIGGLVTTATILSDTAHGQAFYSAGALDTGLAMQFGAFTACGAMILWLAAAGLMKRRDAASCLLALWVFGTFVFAVFFNWTVSGRAVLPIAAAAGIIVMRGLEEERHPYAVSRLALTVITGALVSFSVSLADYSLAETARSAASTIIKRYQAEGRTIWFQGHWGFQYYMEEGKAKPIDFKRSFIAPGEVIVTPLNAPNRRVMPAGSTEYIEELRAPTLSWASTMGLDSGAGFYASEWGPVPYRFGRSTDEVFVITRAR